MNGNGPILIPNYFALLTLALAADLIRGVHLERGCGVSLIPTYVIISVKLGLA